VQFGKPRWSRDGGSILLTGIAAGQVNGLYRLDPTTGALTTILAGKRIIPTEAEWSADGRSIFYIRGESGRRRSLVRYDLADSTPHVVYSPDSLHIVRALTVSRDGRWIAFTTCESNRCTSKALLLATGEIRELPIGRPGGVGFPGGYNNLNWTPDGELIGMKYRGTDDMNDLWRIPIDGRPARQLGFEAKSLVNLRINADGRRVAYVAVTDDPNVGGIWIVENFLPPPRKRLAK
jgi:Tol biopolymer transport system component